jgi:hypothetical protein
VGEAKRAHHHGITLMQDRVGTALRAFAHPTTSIVVMVMAVTMIMRMIMIMVVIMVMQPLARARAARILAEHE